MTIDNYVDGVQYIAIKGDFSKSVSKAEELGGDKYRYGYFLPMNNCLHYAKAILRGGYAYNDFVEDFLTNSHQIVPTLYYDSLNAISQNKVLQKIDQMLMLRRLHEILE